MVQRAKPVEVDVKPDSAEWLGRRQTGVGASDLPIILGMSSFMEPRELFHIKRKEVEPRSVKEWQRFGHLLEPACVAAFTEDTGIQVARYPAPLMQRADNERHLATPDADLVPEAEGLECKNASRFSTVWEGGFDVVPDQYFIQCQWQAYVCNWDRVWLEVLVDGSQTHTLFVDRDDEVIGNLIEAADVFLDGVDSGDAPDWETTPQLDVVKRRFREFSGDVITLDAVMAEKWAERAELNREIRAMQKQADGLKAEVLEVIGDADAAELPGGGFIRRKTIQKDEYTVAATSYVDVRQVKKL